MYKIIYIYDMMDVEVYCFISNINLDLYFQSGVLHGINCFENQQWSSAKVYCVYVLADFPGTFRPLIRTSWESQNTRF